MIKRLAFLLMLAALAGNLMVAQNQDPRLTAQPRFTQKGQVAQAAQLALTPSDVSRVVELADVVNYAEFDNTLSVSGTDTTRTSEMSGMPKLERIQGTDSVRMSGLWGLSGTLKATVDLNRGAISIIPGQLAESSYGAVWAVSFDPQTDKYSTSKPIAGTIDTDGITLGPWGVFVIGGEYSGAYFALLNGGSRLAATNGKMSDYEFASDQVTTYDVRIDQSADGSKVRVANFGGQKKAVTVNLNPDGTASVAPQVVATSSKLGDLMCYRADWENEPGMLQGNIGGTVTASKITLGNWGLFRRAAHATCLVQNESSTITLASGDFKLPAALSLDWTGSGTVADPYVITTSDQLRAFCQQVNGGNSYSGKHIALGADIDLGDAQFDPIGSAEHPFSGHFDGRGHSLTNVTISLGEQPYGGIFGLADASSVIENLTTNGVTISGMGSSLGGLIGRSSGRVNQVAVLNAQITHKGFIGGGVIGTYDGPMLSGATFGGTMSGMGDTGGVLGNLKGNAHATGLATLPGSKVNNDKGLYSTVYKGIGGLVGATRRSNETLTPTLTDSHNMAAVTERTGVGDAGGVVGDVLTGTISKCYNVGLIKGQSTVKTDASSITPGAVGGVAGLLYGGAVTDCYNANVVANTNESRYVGGVIGSVVPPNIITQNGVRTITFTSTVKRCYNSGEVLMQPASATMGVYGSTYSDTIFTYCYFDRQMTRATQSSIKAAIPTAALVSGTLPTGFGTNWVASAGYYPRLQGADGTADARVSAVPVLLADDETTDKVKSNFALGRAPQVSWAVKSAGTALAIEGDSVKLKNASATEVLTAFSGNGPGKVVSLNVLNPSLFSGKGTATDPYELKTADDWVKLNDMVVNHSQPFEGDHFKQVADIDFAGTSFNGVGIGGNQQWAFAGTLDGGNHSITGLNVKGTRAVGLLGMIAKGGEVNNLVLAEGNTIAGTDFVGSLCGVNFGHISNVVSRAKVSAKQSNAGGIVSLVQPGAVVESCYYGGTVVADSSYAGGIAGQNGGTVRQSQNAGNIFAHTAAGGIAGTCGGGAATIAGCINSGNVTSSTLAGGLVGDLLGYAASLNHNINYGIVSCTGNDQRPGALSGTAPAKGSVVSSNIYDAQLGFNGGTPAAQVEGYEGTLTRNLTTGKALAGWDKEPISWAAGQYPVLKAFAGEDEAASQSHMVVTFADLETADNFNSKAQLSAADGLTWTLLHGKDYSVNGNILLHSVSQPSVSTTDSLTATMGNVKRIIALHSVPSAFKGSGTADDPYQIWNTTDMSNLAALVNGHNRNFKGYSFKVMADIDFKGTTYEPVGLEQNLFDAEFNGDGHKFTNLTYSNDSVEAVGLFGNVGSEGYIHDLNLASGSIKASRFTAGFVGTLWGRMERCDNHAAISTGTFGMAGIVAYVKQGANVEQCHNYGTLDGSRSFGACIAYQIDSAAVVRGCVNHAPMSGNDLSDLAGIAYYNYGTVDSCFNYANITGSDNLAGIVLQTHASSVVSRCVNRGNIKADYTDVGGIICRTMRSKVPIQVTECINEGQITGSGSQGGIIGRALPGIVISNCENHASVTCVDGKYVGGLVGELGAEPDKGTFAYTTLLTHSHNTGALSTQKGTAGGLVGLMHTGSMVALSVNEGTITGTGNAVGGIAGECNGEVANSYNMAPISLKNSTSAGGVAGKGNGSISGSFNAGNLTVTDNISTATAGGLVATGSFSLTGSYNLGTISARNGIGGLAAQLSSDASVNACYNAGRVALLPDTSVHEPKVGNLAAITALPLDDCCFDSTVNPELLATGDSMAVALTTRQLTLRQFNGNYVLAEGFYPMSAALETDTLARWAAATVVPAEGDNLMNVTKPLALGDGSALWSTNASFVTIMGNRAYTTATGQATLTKRFGQYARDVVINVKKASGLHGDVNHDGMLNVGDVTQLVNMILGTATTDVNAADMNGDGVLNASDVTEEVNVILSHSTFGPAYRASLKR